MNLHWRLDVVNEIYKIKSSSKDNALDIYWNVFPTVIRENIIVSKISGIDFDELDCVELTEDSVGDNKHLIYN